MSFIMPWFKKGLFGKRVNLIKSFGNRKHLNECGNIQQKNEIINDNNNNNNNNNDCDVCKSIDNEFVVSTIMGGNSSLIHNKHKGTAKDTTTCKDHNGKSMMTIDDDDDDDDEIRKDSHCDNCKISVVEFDKNYNRGDDDGNQSKNINRNYCINDDDKIENSKICITDRQLKSNNFGTSTNGLNNNNNNNNTKSIPNLHLNAQRLENLLFETTNDNDRSSSKTSQVDNLCTIKNHHKRSSMITKTVEPDEFFSDQHEVTDYKIENDFLNEWEIIDLSDIEEETEFNKKIEIELDKEQSFKDSINRCICCYKKNNNYNNSNNNQCDTADGADDNNNNNNNNNNNGSDENNNNHYADNFYNDNEQDLLNEWDIIEETDIALSSPDLSLNSDSTEFHNNQSELSYTIDDDDDDDDCIDENSFVEIKRSPSILSLSSYDTEIDEYCLFCTNNNKYYTIESSIKSGKNVKVFEDYINTFTCLCVYNNQANIQLGIKLLNDNLEELLQSDEIIEFTDSELVSQSIDTNSCATTETTESITTTTTTESNDTLTLIEDSHENDNTNRNMINLTVRDHHPFASLPSTSRTATATATSLSLSSEPIIDEKNQIELNTLNVPPQHQQSNDNNNINNNTNSNNHKNNNYKNNILQSQHEQQSSVPSSLLFINNNCSISIEKYFGLDEHGSIIIHMDHINEEHGYDFLWIHKKYKWSCLLPSIEYGEEIKENYKSGLIKPCKLIVDFYKIVRDIIFGHPRNKTNIGGPGDSIGAYALALADDSTSTFSRNIENFITCTKDSREAAPQIVMRNMRQFMSGMKNYLVKHGEGDFQREVLRARSRLKSDEFLNLDTILENVMHQLVVLPLREHLYGLFVDYYTRSGDIQLLVENVKYACGRSPIDFGIQPFVTPPSSAAMQQISLILVRLQEAELPLEKLELLLNVVTSIFESTTHTRKQALGADEFLPVLVFIVAKCGFIGAEIEAEFMWCLLQQSLLNGEAGYYLTALCSAVHVLKSFKSSEQDGTGSLDIRSSTMPACSSVLRVIIPDECNGSLQTRTLPVRPHTTTKEVCRIIAHKARITNPQDYGLFKLVDGEETILLDAECPQDARLASRGKHCLLAYKRIDAKIAWPTATASVFH